MQTNTEDRPTPYRRKRRRIVMPVLSVALIIAVAASIGLFLKYRQALEANPKTVERRTIQQVQEIIEAPNEEPSVITVLDASKLANNQLAGRAENGDKLLVYAKAERMVIFRPSSGKVVDMLTIRGDDNAADQTSQPQQ